LTDPWRRPGRCRGARHAGFHHPLLEHLEDRLAPAANITIVPGAAGTGSLDHFLSAANGTITTAGDPGATLSTGALAGVGPGVPISIAADHAIVLNDFGSVTLETASGVGAAFSTNTGPITFANLSDTLITSGGALAFSAGTDLAVANLNTQGGDLLVPGSEVFGPRLRANGNFFLQARGTVSIASLRTDDTTVEATGFLAVTGGLGADDNSGGATLQGKVIASAVYVSGGAGNNTFTVNLAAGSSPLVDIRGQGGSDTFDITPSAGTTFGVHGDAPPPPASPGDTLIVRLDGNASPSLNAARTPDGFQGSWTFGDRQPVNFDTIETLIPGADLVVSQSGPATASEGDTLTFTITVVNNGPSDANGVSLTDTLSAGLSLVSATTSQWSFSTSGNVVTFSLGTLAVGATATLTVTATATEDGALTSTATAGQTGPGDPNAANNAAQASTAVGEPPISGSGASFGVAQFDALNNVVVATFSHLNGSELAGDFSATIDWGDDTTSTGTVVLAGGTYQVLGSHTYTRRGDFTLGVTISEDAVFTTLGGGVSVAEAGVPAGVAANPASTFVTKIYADLLHEPPTTSGVRFWTSVLILNDLQFSPQVFRGGLLPAVLAGDFVTVLAMESSLGFTPASGTPAQRVQTYYQDLGLGRDALANLYALALQLGVSDAVVAALVASDPTHLAGLTF
jgi:uncharacterized repeat protein (TIGR01451 family)